MMVLVLRSALAAVFAVAGIAKLRDPSGTRRAAREFGVPAALAGGVAVLLPLAELVSGVALLPERTAGAGAAAATGLLALFVVAIGVNLARGRRPDCNCFGQLHSRPAGWGTIARNLVLTAVAALILAAQEHQVAGAYASVVLAVGGAGVYVADRRRASGDWDEPAGDGGLPVGSPAPAFELPSLDGGRVTLDSFTDRGRAVLLVFSDPHCAPCSELAPKLARWQAAHGDELTIAILERGGEASVPEKYGRRDVLRQRESEVADAYRAFGTPTAVLVDKQGLIASKPAPGELAIEKLVAANVRDFAPAERRAARPLASRPGRRRRSELLGRREALIRLGAASGAVGTGLALPGWATGRSGSAAGKKRPQCRTYDDCSGALECVNGRCGCPKDWGIRQCAHYCVDVNTNFLDCGSCGNACQDGTSTCVDGSCQPGNATCEPPCPRFFVCCGDVSSSRCVDLLDDDQNCGNCGAKCGPNQQCCEGHCRDVASAGDRCVLDRCGLPAKCGTGQVCVRIGSWRAECRDKCPSGLRPCGGTCGDPRTQSCCGGKLFDKDELNFDDRNCGKCGNSCGAGFTCCNGVCVDTMINPLHCGGCNPCPKNCECLQGRCTNCV